MFFNKPHDAAYFVEYFDDVIGAVIEHFVIVIHDFPFF
jgi:hypothetical protein